MRSTAIKLGEVKQEQAVGLKGRTTPVGNQMPRLSSLEVDDIPGDGSVNPLEGPDEKVIETLEFITKLVNKEAFKSERIRNTCILSSFALKHVLSELGYPNVKLVRVTAHVHTQDGGALLGAPPDGVFQRASSGWKGHLVVVVDDRFLLDATLDQATGFGVEGEPCVVKIPPGFGNMECGAPFKVGNCSGWYDLYHRQNGFLHTPVSRPKHWKPIADAVLRVYRRQRPNKLFGTKPVAVAQGGAK